MARLLDFARFALRCDAMRKMWLAARNCAKLAIPNPSWLRCRMEKSTKWGVQFCVAFPQSRFWVILGPKCRIWKNLKMRFCNFGGAPKISRRAQKYFGRALKFEESQEGAKGVSMIGMAAPRCFRVAPVSVPNRERRAFKVFKSRIIRQNRPSKFSKNFINAAKLRFFAPVDFRRAILNWTPHFAFGKIDYQKLVRSFLQNRHFEKYDFILVITFRNGHGLKLDLAQLPNSRNWTTFSLIELRIVLVKIWAFAFSRGT